MGQDPTRSVLLALFAGALGSRDAALGALPRLERRLIEWRAWTPPHSDLERVEVTRSARSGGYRTAATGESVRLGLRPLSRSIVALLYGLPGLALLSYLVLAAMQGELILTGVILLALLAMIPSTRWALRHRARMSIEVDDRRVRGPDAEVPRAEVRYVTSNGESVLAGLVDGTTRELVRRGSREDAMAFAAQLEVVLGLVEAPGEAGRVRVEIQSDDETEEAEDAAAGQDARRREARAGRK